MYMGYTYEWLPDVAIADAAFVARADSASELFIACALATAEVIVDLTGINPCRSQSLAVEAESLEELLHAWLDELIYLKDTKGLIFSEFEDLSINVDTNYSLRCLAHGEEIDQNRHTLGQDVKAVTYHLFGITEKKGRYEARVVLDI